MSGHRHEWSHYQSFLWICVNGIVSTTLSSVCEISGLGFWWFHGLSQLCPWLGIYMNQNALNRTTALSSTIQTNCYIIVWAVSMEIRLASFQNSLSASRWRFWSSSDRTFPWLHSLCIHLQRLLCLLTAVYSWFNCAVKEFALCYY